MLTSTLLSGSRWLQVVGLEGEGAVVSPRPVPWSVLMEQGWGVEGQKEEGEDEGTEGTSLMTSHPQHSPSELGAAAA